MRPLICWKLLWTSWYSYGQWLREMKSTEIGSLKPTLRVFQITCSGNFHTFRMLVSFWRSFIQSIFAYWKILFSGTLKTESVGGEKCFYQNLNICFLFLIFYPKNQQKFNKFRSKVFSYVKGKNFWFILQCLKVIILLLLDCISFWKVKDNDFNDLLTRFISKAFLENNSLYEPESRKLFGSLIEKYDFEKPSKENDIKLMILCNMIEKSDIVDKR